MSAEQPSAEQQLIQRGIVLPAAWKDEANRVRALRSGIHVFMSGHGPLDPATSAPLVTGKLGRELSIEAGYAAARLAGLACLGTLRGHLGNLDRVTRVVRVLGFINCAPGFNTPSNVLHGFSDLMVAVFGEKGKHARSAVGMYALPSNIAVEVEMIVELEN